jgi:hypothetical protein
MPVYTVERRWTGSAAPSRAIDSDPIVSRIKDSSRVKSQ